MSIAMKQDIKRWAALTRYLEDGCVPIDNNHIEQQIRPLALGRKNWLFAASLRAGQRAAAVMTLIQSAKLNGHDPLAYLGDILQRLPTQPNHRIHELLPHHWRPAEQYKTPQKNKARKAGLVKGCLPDGYTQPNHQTHELLP